MTAPLGNLLLMLDDNLVAALDDVRMEALDAMDRYTDAKEREAQLSALLELRRRSGARIQGLPTHVASISGAA
jgi:hypothetical protein